MMLLRSVRSCCSCADERFAVANMVWLLLVVAGGIVLSVHALPGVLSAIAAALPSGALAEGLRTALVTGITPWAAVGILLAWAIAAGILAARTLRLS